MKKLAIVYDWLDKWGGVERMLLVLHEMYPKADFISAHYNEQTASWAKKLNIKTSFMQKLPRFILKNRIISSILYPYAFESLNLNEYDTVISVTSSFAKGIVTKPETKHISIILTPTRFLWVAPHLYKQVPFISWLVELVMSSMRKWDFLAAQRPDKLISISKLVDRRIQHFYRRPSEVIYPPFDEAYWKSITIKKPQIEGYYLIVSRLETYKKVNIAVSAFNFRPEDKLIIIGGGTQKQILQQQAKDNITFISGVSDEELAGYYSNAKAVIMPQEEDFGYVALEALFFGKPVLCYAKSGVAEIVREGTTGFYFAEQTRKSLETALERLGDVAYNVTNGIKKDRDEVLKEFSKKTFITKLRQVVENEHY